MAELKIYHKRLSQTEYNSLKAFHTVDGVVDDDFKNTIFFVGDMSDSDSFCILYLGEHKSGDEGGSSGNIQTSTLPTAGSEYLGKIYQYIGTTDTNYTHGYFYECTVNGSTYSWTQLNTQNNYTVTVDI